MSNHPTDENDQQGVLQASPLPGQPTAQIGRLKAFLEASFPGEVERSNTQTREYAADTAIRLLSHRTAISEHIVRCPVAYCNQPKGHTSICPSWTN